MTDRAAELEKTSLSAQRLTLLVCSCTVICSVVSCLAIATIRSSGLTQVTVTALDAAAEPRDHNLPLIKQTEALPDYRITINLSDRRRIDLGSKPNTSAIDGLTWVLPDPVSITEVVSVRLDDRDKLISDALSEVQLIDDSATSGNYLFEFETQRLFSVGIRSFFRTPIGLAISAAFTTAILLVLLSALVGSAEL